MRSAARGVRFGPPAAVALRQAIADAKSGDALVPVTVVVSRGPVGLAMRRLLSSDRLGPPPYGARPGLINVGFVTLARLAHDLGAPTLERSGRRPLTDAVLSAAAFEAVRAAGETLGTSDTPPAALARALAATWRVLRGVPETARRRLAGHGARASTVVGLVDAVTGLLGGWYDDCDAASEACRLLAATGDAGGTGGGASAAGAALHALGPVVWYLPASPPAPWAPDLVGALAARVPVTALVGLTGEAAADEPAVELCRRLGMGTPTLGPPDSAGSGVAAPAAAPGRPRMSVVNAPSADAEILVAVRGAVERLEAGVAAERIAIVDGGDPVYRRQLRETLSVAGIPFHGAAVRTLAATVPGRTLLGLFELADRGWHREDVIGWMSGAPLRDRVGAVPATRWDLVSRRAGITGGLDAWQLRLAEYEAERRQRLADAVTPTGRLDGHPDLGDRDEAPEPDAAVDGLRRRVAEVERLRRFVRQVAGRLEEVPDTWEGWAAWSLSVLDELLGGPASHRSWPDVEVQARDAVREAVVGLAALDRLGGPSGPRVVDQAAWCAALGAELDRPAPDVSRTGRGLMVGHVDELVGLDVDVAFIVGMVDGAYPTLRSDDPLLPDRLRAGGGTEVPARTGRQADARRRHLAALAGVREAVLSFARGDQRQGREQRPARWLLDALEEIQGGERRLYARDLSILGPFDGYRIVESYTAAVRGDGAALSLADHDVRSVTRWRDEVGALRGHPLAGDDPAFACGLEAQAARRSGRFTRFDGLTAGAPLPSPTDTVQSPTSLEKYAACPRQYFLARILRLTVHERPEAVVRIEPSDRGVVIHRILERFVAATFLGDAPRDAGAPYSPSDLGELERITREELAEAERRGWAGPPALWHLDRSAIVRDVERFPEEDRALRARLQSVPESVELSFGPPPIGSGSSPHPKPAGGGATGAGGAGEVAVPTGAGAPVRFRGMIDRVDRTPDGGAVVIDYKTGAAFALAEIEDDAAHGRRLQLPIYALAASRRTADADVPPAKVRAFYWYVSDKGDFARAELEFDEAAYQQLTTTVTSMVESIAAGVFPANPGPLVKDDGSTPTFRNCRFCDFDALCSRDRGSEWTRKHLDPALSPYTRWSGS